MGKCNSCKYWIPDDAIRCGHCGADQRKGKAEFWKGFAFFTNIATLFMAFSIVWQSCSLSRQTNIIRRSFELENRPYLYIDIAPVAISQKEKHPNSDTTYDNLYVGADLIYKNVGKLPACNIKSEIHFYSDMDSGDNFERLKKWYEKELGSFPQPTTIFPNQEGQKIPTRVDCSELTKDYMFTIRISYTGQDPRKIYWYSTDIKYSIEKGFFKQKTKIIQQGNDFVQVPGEKEYIVYLVSANSDYDRGGAKEMPPVILRPYK